MLGRTPKTCVSCQKGQNCNLHTAAADKADGVCDVLQPITGESADAIAKECPGLFEVEGKGRNKKASVKPAREHTRLLEKVLLHMTSTCWQAVT